MSGWVGGGGKLSKKFVERKLSKKFIREKIVKRKVHEKNKEFCQKTNSWKKNIIKIIPQKRNFILKIQRKKPEKCKVYGK